MKTQWHKEVQLDISVRVEMAEFRNWKPDQISAFFGGIAQVHGDAMTWRRLRNWVGGFS